MAKKFWRKKSNKTKNFKNNGKMHGPSQSDQSIRFSDIDASYRESLSSINLEGGKLKKGTNALKTLNSSAIGHFKGEGNLRKAGIGTLRATAGSAAAHGGLAYLQGDDPWEAAKTGAFRGALGGAGYQYLKAGTGANSMHKGLKGIKDNGRQIISGGRDIARAHSIRGNMELRQKVSPQLKRVLEQKERNEMTGGLFGLKTK